MESPGPRSTLKSCQVFSIPELATLVARFSTKQDCARLLQTCKTLYDVAVPFVWETVRGAQHLLLLLHEAGSYRSSHGEKVLEIYLVESFWASSNLFVRFDFYASHVKYLDIYGPKAETFKVSGWKVLVARAQQKVLLPNLHTLTIGSTNALIDQSMWVGTFSSPSLVNLLVTDGNLWDTPTVSYPAASFMMKSLAAHRPKLERLELFPLVIIGDHIDNGESDLLAFLSGDPFYEYTAHFTDLRRLACTFVWLNEEPALRILSKLPHLEAIDIRGIDYMEGEVSAGLSDDSFPSLRSLHLHQPNPLDAARAMKILQMVKGLTSLRISLDAVELIHAGVDEGSWFIHDFFPLLLNMPHITDLWIDADPGGKFEDDVEIDESVMGIFQTLSLRSLHLGQMRLNHEALQLDLELVWPSIVQFCMPQQAAPLAILSLFTFLPNLRHLELELDLDELELELEYAEIVSPLTVLQASPGSTLGSNLQEADQIIRALLDIFPNLIHVNWPADRGSASPDCCNPTYEHKYEQISFANGRSGALLELLAFVKQASHP
ncbi:hypothetical protein FRC12_005158 [Ceratobasidium sp. 428]|nr:hypothetical protein FRC09_010888 [Ceratobasidium sp. 395]KAG8792701.1 hypothetical protein FRC12_005158 [Ceratobasidium sp. 428]